MSQMEGMLSGSPQSGVDTEPYYMPGNRSLLLIVVIVVQSCPTLCDPMDYSPAGSSVHGILQARILEWGVTSFFRRSS